MYRLARNITLALLALTLTSCSLLDPGSIEDCSDEMESTIALWGTPDNTHEINGTTTFMYYNSNISGWRSWRFKPVGGGRCDATLDNFGY